jgi:hypothetical protein
LPCCRESSLVSWWSAAKSRTLGLWRAPYPLDL